MEFPLDFTIAQSLYMGIVYDTGSFVYPKTSELTLHVASRLVGMGVQPYTLYNNLYENSSVSSLILMSKVLSTLELYSADRIAVQTMTQSDIKESQATTKTPSLSSLFLSGVKKWKFPF